MSQIGAVISVGRAFAKQEKQLVLGITIHTSMVSIAGIIYPYLLKWLAQTYGLNGTFLILGGLFTNTFVFFAFLWQQHLAENSDFIAESEGNTDEDTQIVSFCDEVRQILNVFRSLISIPFVCLIVALALAISCVNAYLELAFDIAAWKGYNESETKELFVILNCLNVFATLTPGIIKQKFEVNSFIFLIISSFAGCVGHVLINSSNSYLMYAVASGCIGLVPGGIIAVSLTFIMETMKKKQVSVATGLMFTVTGVLSAAVGPLFGMYLF